MRHVRRLALLLLAVVLGAGCSGDDRTLPDTDTQAIVTTLRTEQDRLRELVPDAGDVSDELQEVVTRTGFARTALATDSIGEGEIADVTTAVDAFVGACVPSSGSGS